jgi:hypothetical protein
MQSSHQAQVDNGSQQYQGADGKIGHMKLTHLFAEGPGWTKHYCFDSQQGPGKMCLIKKLNRPEAGNPAREN